VQAADENSEDRMRGSRLRVAVIGAGGVGLGLGSCLLRAGADVLFVVRGEGGADALRTHGIERTGVFGNARFAPDRFEVDTRYARIATWEADHVLVCTKTTECDAVAEGLRDGCSGRWSEDGVSPEIVLCQNGWGSAERFAACLPARQVYSARVITGFRRDAPFRVEITVHAEAIHIGSLYGGDLAAIEGLCRAIDEGGIPCAPTAEIERDLLSKLLYNCALNPLAALRGVPYGEVGSDPASRATLEAVVREIFGVLSATGLETHWETPDAYVSFFFDALLPPTRGHESSMLQDLRAGRRTEIDALCGAVVRLGRSAGVEAPVNAALATLIRAIEPGG
jgi:2-dehydropantoate 2-reductase